MIDEQTTKARYIMIGGFLGAGKTTAVAQLARHLTDQGLKVGLICNDQSTGLVDTALLRSKGFHVEEIVGGCFCCRFNSLVEAANRLTSQTKPDVFVAEPVGSCTDLVATVSYPLRRIYGDRFTIAPLSVLVDPIRGARIMGITEGKSFSEKVVYVYRKQLEEADLILINKCDLVAESLRDELVAMMQNTYPRVRVYCCSAKDGTGLKAWFSGLMETESGHAPTMEIDYDRYAEGEALLGWLNGTVKLAGAGTFDGNALLLNLTDRIQERLERDEIEIAHLKMTLDAGDAAGNLSVVSVVDSHSKPDLRESLLDEIDNGELIINLRAEAAPGALRDATLEALEKCIGRRKDISMEVVHMECFRPARPTPTHRD